MEYKIGDVLRVISAGEGALACNGCMGIVTDKLSSYGIFRNDKSAFNIKITSNNSVAKIGQVWRVNLGGKYELIRSVVINPPASNVHIYEHLPRTLNVLIKNPDGQVFQTQTINSPQFTYKTIYNGLATIVILEDGNKGVAKCNPSERYSRQTGHDIAYIRARIKKLEKELKQICGK